ncbi:MAG: tryptophan synthase subunit beta [Bacilli bacterium]|nr:tryptophan synthase subunit beta [Bacilli bacterium]
MIYISVKEAATKWGLNERRVRALCEQGRVDGAFKDGKSYLIPEIANKPIDKRIKFNKDDIVRIKLNADTVDFKTYKKVYPNKEGFFGKYGGSFVGKDLQKAFNEVYSGYLTICKSARFIEELRRIRRDFQGRPTPLYHCERLSTYLGKVQIYLKREDLNHTGSHKLNHCMGEALLAKYLGKKKLIAETGAGSHGVAVATAAAYFGLECEIHMGAVDIKKQAPNVARMKILGANVIEVNSGTKTLKEAVDSAFEAYSKQHKSAFYCMGSVVGPHPFPLMVRDFQEIIGKETREQFIDKTGELPDIVCACTGGGSNSIGMFEAFLDDPVSLVGVEAAGKDNTADETAASITFGKDGTIHGFKSIVLQDSKGNIKDASTIASGLDYPGVGPEHAFLHSIGRVNYAAITDDEAVEAFFLLSKLEGIIPAIESAHALAYAIKCARTMHSGSIVVCLSGRGDKDLDYMIENYTEYMK